MLDWAKPFLAGAACVAVLGVAAQPVRAKEPGELAGTWNLAFDKTGATCPVLLRAQRSDKGDFFLGMSAACRHAIPGVAAVGRWGIPDASHLTLDDPSGTPLLNLTLVGEGYALAERTGTYTLKPAAAERSAEDIATSSLPSAAPKAPLVLIATHHSEPAEPSGDMAGRYAVMREKHDTGCMVTLDRAHTKSGDRAQLAPGCRDQGIVVFDPSAWQVVRGELVLIARAGHKTKLEKQGEGLWERNAKEGKPLGLKKL